MPTMEEMHAEISKSKTDAHASGDTSGFMANAVKGMRDMIRSGPLGPAIGPAADESAQRVFGHGPDQT